MISTKSSVSAGNVVNSRKSLMASSTRPYWYSIEPTVSIAGAKPGSIASGAAASCHAGCAIAAAPIARAMSIEAWALSCAHWAAERRFAAGAFTYCSRKLRSSSSTSTNSRNGISAKLGGPESRPVGVLPRFFMRWNLFGYGSFLFLPRSSRSVFTTVLFFSRFSTPWCLLCCQPACRILQQFAGICNDGNRKG